MRGVSALDRALAKKAGARIAVLVVWEHVDDKPIAPAANAGPSARALSRDPRAVQFWDPRDLASDALKEKPTDDVLWDVVLIYPPGAKWGSTPSFSGGNVIDVADEVGRRL